MMKSLVRFVLWVFHRHEWCRVCTNMHGDCGTVTISFRQCQKCGTSEIAFIRFAPYNVRTAALARLEK